MSSEGQTTEPQSQTATVLVATSDSATRDLLRRILHVGAVDVIDASDGVEALALARRLDLDLVVLDGFLAVMDGISVCGRIRALVDIDQPPILIVGLSSERAVEVALAAGADETLPKPLNPALIRHRTRALLKRHLEGQRLRLIERAVAAAPVGMTVLDARSSEYSLTLANPAFLQLTGHTAEEIKGKNLRLLKGPDTDVAAMTQLRDSMAEGRRARVLLKNYRKDGQAFWNDLATAPVLDASGRLTHYVAVQHDVSALIEAPEHEAARAIEEAVGARTRDLESTLARVEERRRFTETILNSMVSGILATDASGTVTFANLAALRTLGTSLADCVGRSVVEIFGHHEGVAEVIGDQGPSVPEHRLDFPFINPGGARFYVGMSITRSPEEFSDEVGFIFLFRNLAETIEDDTDPRLRQMTLDEGAGDDDHGRLLRAAGERRRARGAAFAEAGGPGGWVLDPKADEATPAGVAAEASALVMPRLDDLASEEQAARRRVLLALRYSSPADMVRRAIDGLASRFDGQAPPIQVEAAAGLPEVLLDRQQTTEALTLLIGSAVERCGAPARVRVRLTPTEAVGDKGVHPTPSVRIEIIYPRAFITETDLGADADSSGRQAYRRTDLATAEKLIEANGGRLVRPLRDSEEQVLTVLLRAAR